jgi:hypothetical protein
VRFWTSTDQAPIGAGGAAVLRALGSNQAIANRNVLDQEQIARAVELGLGAPSSSASDLFSVDEGSLEYCAVVRGIQK